MYLFLLWSSTSDHTPTLPTWPTLDAQAGRGPPTARPVDAGRSGVHASTAQPSPPRDPAHHVAFFLPRPWRLRPPLRSNSPPPATASSSILPGEAIHRRRGASALTRGAQPHRLGRARAARMDYDYRGRPGSGSYGGGGGGGGSSSLYPRVGQPSHGVANAPPPEPPRAAPYHHHGPPTVSAAPHPVPASSSTSSKSLPPPPRSVHSESLSSGEERTACHVYSIE